MKEITVKELEELTKGGLYNITSDDTWGMSVDMINAMVGHDEENGELVFFKPGASEIRFNIDDAIECMQFDENDGEITIEFSLNISDMVIRKTV